SPKKIIPPVFEGIPSTSLPNPSPTNNSLHPKNANHSKNITSNPVNADSIGHMINAFGVGFGVHQAVWADPRLNTVAVIHRSAPAVSGETLGGYLRYDVSKD